MRKTALLKKLIIDEEILVMPGAFDALSAKVIEHCGFKALQCSGYGIAASRIGVPDIGILSMEGMLDQTRNICSAVTIPVMADGDTGFGNAVNIYHCVQAFESAGAAGINLEDQVFPKRCGHMDGKAVIPMEEMIKKIQAAVEAKRDPDFVINARTDAIAVYGPDEAVRRGNAYANAGADLIFVEAPSDIEMIKRVIREIEAPVSINLTDGGKTPIATISELQEWGAKRVSVPVTPVFSAVRGMMDALKILKEEGSPPSLMHPEKVVTFMEFTDLVELPKYQAINEKFGF